MAAFETAAAAAAAAAGSKQVTTDRAQVLTLCRTVVSDLTPELPTLETQANLETALLGEHGAHPAHRLLRRRIEEETQQEEALRKSSAQEVNPSTAFVSRESASYVTHVTTSLSGNTVATASTRPLIELWTHELDSRDSITDLNHTITDMSFSAVDPEHLLLISSLGGDATIFDTRVCAAAARFQGTSPMQSVHSGGPNKTLIVGACGNDLIFWDVRNGKRLQRIKDAHFDTITQVRFHPVKTDTLITAGHDGMVNMIDSTKIHLGEDCIFTSLNVEEPLETLGFYGPTSECLVCLTGNQTVSLWSLSQETRIGYFPRIRTDLQVDYLVNSHFHSRSQSCLLFGGTFAGDLTLIEVAPTSVRGLLSLHGHQAMIRSTAWTEQGLYSVGEDARVCFWTEPTSGSQTKPVPVPRRGGGAERRSRQPSTLHAPY